MALGNEIVVESQHGKKVEGIIDAALLPGVVVQIKAATEPQGGRLTWEAYNADADGNRRLVAVLDIDHLQGKTATDAYAANSRCFIWIPMPGDELNMVQNAAGTADDIAIGDLFIINDGDGKLLATTGTVESEPFIAMETVTDPGENTLVHMMFTGY